MTQDIIREQFKVLRDEAYSKIQLTTKFEGFFRVFTFKALPSFSCPWRMTLYSPRGDSNNKESFLELSVWRSDADWEILTRPVAGLPVLRLRKPETLSPTFNISTQVIDEASVADILKTLSIVEVHPFFSKDKSIGLDGTTYEFEFGEYRHGMKVSWHNDGPQEWRKFTTAVMQVGEELKLVVQKNGQG